MDPFRFKQFEVYDHHSTMKVGTDGVTLGAFSSRSDFRYALDMGTGCGLIALMLAQKSSGHIVAIDIDEPSVKQAASNFAASPWNTRLTARCVSAQELAGEVGNIFDRIVSNPPYFIDSLKSPDARRTNARHNVTLSLEELVTTVDQLLTPDGVFDVILPVEVSIFFESLMYYSGLYLREELILFSMLDKPIRKILSFCRNYNGVFDSGSLIIRKDAEHHTQEYIDFTADFFPGLR
ncbi:tRNA1(Val) (adenine(37)-N6)-methyltransferase [bioreactor metagenome]|uniref:tRNA1(Val) (Adenine(37)-N6)-methyltransferase n=1 Tax=bioreactor metagenome TaxID=1076179 RepID=A0A644WE58_9ZZZZ